MDDDTAVSPTSDAQHIHIQRDDAAAAKRCGKNCWYSKNLIQQECRLEQKCWHGEKEADDAAHGI